MFLISDKIKPIVHSATARAFLPGVFIIVIFLECLTGGISLAIWAEISLCNLRDIFINLAPTYGIIMSLVAVSVVYKRARISERLSKYSDEFKTFPYKWPLTEIKVGEKEIIDTYESIFPKLTDDNKKRAKAIYEELKSSSINRHILTLHLERFMIVNFLLFLIFIILLFFWKTESLISFYIEFFEISLFLIAISIWTTIQLGRVLKA